MRVGKLKKSLIKITLNPTGLYWDDSYRSDDVNSTTAYTQNYDYDLMGNLNELQYTGDSNFTRTYNHSDNLLESFEVGSNTYYYQYDACGNQIQENDERHMQWDYADKLRLYYNQTSSGTEPSVYTHYLYDAGGNRVKKYTRTAGGNWETITYLDGLIEYRENYPFGETSFGSYAKKRYRFCGKEKDEETRRVRERLKQKIIGKQSGMYYYGARYYSPWLCRFISVDPKAGKYVFQTPYAYADNNPINKMDYNGEGTGEGGGEASVSENNIKGGTPTPENKPNDTPGFFTNLWRVFTNQTHLSRAEKYSSVISKCASKVHVVNIDENTAVVVARFDYAEVKNDKGEVVEKAHSEYRYSVFRESKPRAKFGS